MRLDCSRKRMSDDKRKEDTMVRDLYENEFGIMEGTFYSELFGYDIQVMYAKDIPLEYVEKNIQYLNHLEPEVELKICAALKRFYEFYKAEFPDLCDECEEILGDVSKAFEEGPRSVFQYISIGTYQFDKYDAADEEIPVINLRGDCAWSGDAGITIAARNNQLLYVGTWEDLNVWSYRAESKLQKMFNYAIPKDGE